MVRVGRKLRAELERHRAGLGNTDITLPLGAIGLRDNPGRTGADGDEVAGELKI